MKVSILLIILGFSQVLGRNYGSLTESKSEREDQLDAAPSEFAQPKTVECQESCSSSDEDYGNTGCRVFKQGVQNQKDVCLRINIKEIVEL